MSKTKYTAGPWQVDEVLGLITADNGKTEVAACHAGRGGDANANARLIATAPELLDSCVKARAQIVALVNQINSHYGLELDPNKYIDGCNLDRAINKAQGKE